MGSRKSHDADGRVDERSPLLPFPTSSSGSSLGQTYPSEKSTTLSKIFFSWLTPLLELGNRRPLQASDLFQLDPENRAASVRSIFEHSWIAEVGLKKDSPSIVWCLFRSFGKPFYMAGVLKLVHDSLIFVAPMVIQGVIKFLNDPEAPLSQGLVFAGIIFISGVVQSFCIRQYFYYCYLTGMKFRSAIVTAVYQKSLRLSSAARQHTSTGEITNLMSVDAQRLQDLTPYLHGIWYGFFQITVSITLLYQQIGVACFAGVATIVLTIPVTAFIARIMRTLQKKLMLVKDDRIKICYEVLSGMKVIKYQAWEMSFTDRVMEYRDKELKQARTYILTQAMSGTVFNTVPALVAVLSFITFVALGNELDVGVALTSLSLFNILRFPLFMLPQVLNNVVEATVSFKRLTSFLLQPEVQAISSGNLTQAGIELHQATFEYEEPKKTSGDTENPSDTETQNISTRQIFKLRDISAKFSAGKMVAIVGPVGSGKTTLINGILGDMNVTSGHVFVKGSLALVSQQSFIQNATVEDNILFGKPMNRKQYLHAIRVSALEPDLAMLPGQDQTEIGEKGINLSGGQRIRVSIARAVYQNADIYLLDDPLAAVDGHVGQEIFHQCFVRALSNKVRILVTHGLQYLRECDDIVVLNRGEVVQQGNYDTLSQDKDGLLWSLMKVDKDAGSSGSSQKTDETKESEKKEAQEEPQEKKKDGDTPPTSNTSSSSSVQSSSSVSATKEDVSTSKSSALMTEEGRSTGDVPFKIYHMWITAAGGWMGAMAVLVAYVVAQGVNVASTVWLSHWSEYGSPDTQMYYVSIYASLNLSYALMIFARLMALYIFGLRASRELFRWLFSTIMRAPMSFFDTTPLGRIVNRLSKDMYAVDEQIPSSWNMYISCIMSVVATLSTIVYVTPMFSLALIPIIYGYYRSQRYFISTSRELQRLDSISRSPVYALLSETLDGLSTIRAYAAERRFERRNDAMLNLNQQAYYLNFTTNCWLALRLEFAGTCVATFAALFSIVQHSTTTFERASSSRAAGASFAGLAGVSLSYALTVTQTLNWSVRMISQLQTQMVSVERIQSYIDMPVERALLESKKKKKTHESWPEAGQICFENVSLQYRVGLPKVLRHVTLDIAGGSKVGIVGRTGAGKSSLFIVLMRLVELTQGRVVIDRRDIAQLGLHALRTKLAIIPQDPVLFSGTVRSNLDPFHECPDAALWHSLTRAHLRHKIEFLDQRVSEQGLNFSVGERQLLCIARALLRPHKILLMDEATASIDVQTDQAIQESLREEFRDCTVLTIAHRMNTVMDSTHILVMDNGQVAEYDTVEKLMQKKDGIFHSLVQQWKSGRHQD